MDISVIPTWCLGAPSLSGTTEVQLRSRYGTWLVPIPNKLVRRLSARGESERINQPPPPIHNAPMMSRKRVITRDPYHQAVPAIWCPRIRSSRRTRKQRPRLGRGTCIIRGSDQRMSV